MKFTVQKQHLVEGLQKLIKIIGSRSTLPVLANVLFEAEGDTLTMTTTDLEIRLSTKIKAQIERPGKTTLPGKRLASWVSIGRSDEPLTIDVGTNHHAELTASKGSLKLLGMPDDDFPLPVDFTPVRRFKVAQSEMGRMLDQISYAASVEDSRKVLHGVLLSIKEGTFTTVATDGKRLALVEKMIENMEGEDGDSILPRKSAEELVRLLDKEGEVNVDIGDKQIYFSTETSSMTSKLIEGNYPNYRQVIPTSFSKLVPVSRDEFLMALHRTRTVLSESGSFIKLSFNNNRLTFQATSTDVGEGTDYMDIEFTEPEITISFNPGFLDDPFRHMSADKVSIKLNDGFSPVGIEGGDGFLYVIMPMRNK